MQLAEHLAADRELIGHAFNFSNESQVTVLELVEHILRLMNSDLEPHILNEASNEIRAQYLSAAKARVRLLWEPEFTLESGLQRTIGWYQQFFAQQNGVPGAKGGDR
jgi:CDP-glucose 4,6-dehydratase